MRRLYILVEGCSVPIVLTLPPTSIKGWETYRANLAVERQIPLDVLTEFSITQKQNGTGIKYSAVKFKALGVLGNDNRSQVKALGSGNTYNKSITGDDYNVQSTSAEPA